VAAVSLELAPLQPVLDKYAQLPMRQIQRMLRPHWRQCPFVPKSALSQIRLDPSQRTTVSHFDGTQLLTALEKAAGTDQASFRALILALQDLKLLEWRSVAASQARLTTLEPDLRARLSQLKSLNPFEGLGVHWSTYDAGIDKQAHRLRVELEMSFVTKAGNASLKTLAAELDREIDKAVQALRTWSQRELIRGRFVDASARKSAIEHLNNKGKLLLFRGDVHEARDTFKRCLELSPSDPIAKHHLSLIPRG